MDYRTWLENNKLHGPPKLVDKTNFGLVIDNHANFYRFEETSSYWSVKRISVFLCFSSVNQRHTSCITVYNRTVTNIENTVRAVHSFNSWLKHEQAHEAVKYLCLEIGISVICINEIMLQCLSDDRNFRPLQNTHNMETVYPITKLQGP